MIGTHNDHFYLAVLVAVILLFYLVSGIPVDIARRVIDHVGRAFREFFQRTKEELINPKENWFVSSALYLPRRVCEKIHVCYREIVAGKQSGRRMLVRLFVIPPLLCWVTVLNTTSTQFYGWFWAPAAFTFIFAPRKLTYAISLGLATQFVAAFSLGLPIWISLILWAPAAIFPPVIIQCFYRAWELDHAARPTLIIRMVALMFIASLSAAFLGVLGNLFIGGPALPASVSQLDFLIAWTMSDFIASITLGLFVVFPLERLYTTKTQNEEFS